MYIQGPLDLEHDIDCLQVIIPDCDVDSNWSVANRELLPAENLSAQHDHVRAVQSMVTVIRGSLDELVQHLPEKTIRRLRRDGWVDAADRLTYLLEISREQDDVDSMSVVALRGAAMAIGLLPTHPVAIGLDHTGELEVIWRNANTSVEVTIDFLEDGSAWYDVSAQNEHQESGDTSVEQALSILRAHMM